MFAWYVLLGIAAVFDLSTGHPIGVRVTGSVGVDPSDEVTNLYVLGIGFLVVSTVCIILCTCCKQNGFKEFSNPGSVTNVGFTNALATEVAIFPPPPGPVQNERRSPTSDSLLVPPPSEPPTHPSKPSAFTTAAVPQVNDWFADVRTNFPRQQLFYQKEIGKGWFGKVVEGEARGTKVVVRILREDATPEEKAYFLHEAKPFRDLRHKNVCRLFGQCLEIEPYLLLFELQCNDLKNFLVENSFSRRAINEQGINLKIMTDVSEGLKFMNDNGFIHTDVATRNCLITSDLTTKIGDHGTSVDIYKNEYYIAADVAVPIRWCAPETLHCTPTTIETKQVTAQANVWSLAVLLWEIAEFGRMPYDNLSDDQVIVRVFGAENFRLPEPDCPFGQYLYNIMQICWRPSETRATIDEVLSMLRYLKTNPFQESDFDAKWKKFKPNTVPIVDNHTPIHSPRHTELIQRSRLPTKSEFDSGVDLEIKPNDESHDSGKTSTPMTISPQLSVTSEDIFQVSQKKSPSLTNLQGSFEDVSQFDSWLQGVEQKTEEDRNFVRHISEAIKNLDETLALEKTSSSSADSSLEDTKKPLIDFKLGPFGGERKSESSSDTEEETWRHRVERGEFTEKVKEKSKSVTDLMVLTHIDSEESENDSLPSLTKQYSLKKSGPKGTTYTSIGFGSEGNIHNAVLSEELQEKLKSLTIRKPDVSLGGTNSKSPPNEGADIFLGAPSEASQPLLTSTTNHVQLFLNHEVEAANRNIETEPIPNEEKSFLVEAASVIDTSPQQPVIHEVEGSAIASDVNDAEVTHSKMKGVNIQMEGVNIQMAPLVKMENAVTLHSSNNHSIQLPEAALSSLIPLDPLSHSPIFNPSQHDNSVPKIVITESEYFSPDVESEINEETQHLVDIVPRKFIFVCKDKESEHRSDSCTLVLEEPPKEVDLNVNQEEVAESSVILGSSEEHTLDFFKGLKTSFSPIEYSDDEDRDWLASTSSANDDCLEDEHTSESTVVAYQGHSDKLTLNDLSARQNCDDPTESVESSPTNSDSFLINYSSETCLSSEEQSIGKQILSNDDLPEVVPLPMLPTTFISDAVFDITEHHQESLKDSGCELLMNGKVDSLSNSEVAKPEVTTDDSYSELNSSSSHDSPVNTKDVTKSSVSGNIEINPSLVTKKLQVLTAPKNHGIKVSKSKSLESILGVKNDFEAFKPMSDTLEAVPVFGMMEITREDVFSKTSNFDTYFTVNSGHCLDRSAAQNVNRNVDQDTQMNDLKKRLEDVMKCNDDFQLRNSEDEYGGKLLTPDDERSSDSGFRDKGSLSESVEDTCDEKYNLEDIDAELDDYGIKGVEKDDMKYYGGIDSSLESDIERRENGWMSLSTEDDERRIVTLDDEFVAAIRSELEEKLPCAHHPQKSEEEPTTEDEIPEPATQFTYPAQLSPILEEQESNQSSLVMDEMSPVLILPHPEINIEAFREDVLKALESDESPEKESVCEHDIEGADESLYASSKYSMDEDVLVVDTETNEATIIESSKKQTNFPFILSNSLKDDESSGIKTETCIVTPNDACTVSLDNPPLTPDISLGSNTLSSPDNGNISGMYMSPCSVRSDLFDSGPPSLPFDLGQSIDEIEDVSGDSPKNEDTEIASVFDNNDNTKESECESPTLKCDVNKKAVLIHFTEANELNFVNMPTSEVHTDLEKACSDNYSLPISLNEGTDQSTENSLIQTSLATGVPPLIVIEEEISKHKKAELEIELLLGKSSDCKVEDVDELPAISSLQDRNAWLRQLLVNVDTFPKESSSQEADVPLQDWFNNEDSVVDNPLDNCSSETQRTLKPSISSTLALMSPDLSSTDSKSHSLLSSFSSTPTYEDSKSLMDDIKDQSRVAPSSLSLESTNVCAPMPSPEDAEKGWRPTICQLMELTDQAEGEEMTTSFIEPDENGIYTPDWDSDSSDEQSSTSSEFVWKEGDVDDLNPIHASDSTALLQEPNKMDRIDEEEEDNHESSDGDSCSEGSGTEFIPSTWNAMATPVKSSIKLTNSSTAKTKLKRVVFKKEKYQCIYEYPREPSDDEDSPDPWQAPSSAVFDYSTYADWDLGDVEVGTPGDGDMSDGEEQKKTKKSQDFDFYRLNYSMGSNLVPEDGEFYISSSNKVFDWNEGNSSEFFPGRIADDMEFLPGASELTPLNLGELRHTKDSLRLELPNISRNPDKAEANILDSGIDTASPLLDKP